jgi:hypothetical protein
VHLRAPAGVAVDVDGQGNGQVQVCSRPGAAWSWKTEFG